MKTTLRLSLLLLGWLNLNQHAVWAQCPAGSTTTLGFASRNGEDWDVTTAPNLTNPLGNNIGGTPTDVTAGNFTPSASSPASYLQVRQYGGLLGLGDENRQLDYPTLEWFADYTSNAAKSSSVTFAFSRPLYNYTITLQDIDQAGGTTPSFIDGVRLDGYDVNGNLVNLPASSFTYGTTYQSVSGNTVTGISDINNNSNNTGLVTVAFPVGITKLVVTYSNGTTTSNPAQQAIGISQMTWCKVQPVAKNDSRDVPLNTTVNGNVVLNDDDDEQNPFTATLLSGPTNGSVTFNPDGTYRYSPATNYTGPDSFTYRVCNAAAGSTTLCSGTATVNLRVYSTNTACTSASGSNLLANADFNAGNTGFTTTYRYVATAYDDDTSTGVYPEGTYTVGSNATTYHPNFQGTGHTAGATNDKFLIVNGASAIRTFYSQTVTVQPNRYYTFSAFFNNLLPPGPATGDGIPEMGFVINGESVSGTIRADRSPDTWFSFSDVWFSGNNTQAVFEIRNVSTASGGNDLAVDDVYFGSCNLAPTAIADAATTNRNVAVAVSVLANDIDTDSNNSFSTSTIDVDPTQPGVQDTRIIANQGTFAVNPGTGVVTFTPETGFVGTAVTSYVALDGSAAPTNPASIVVTVQLPTADLAVRVTAPANNATVTAGQPVTFTVQTTNNGTVTAGGVAPTVQLPAGLTGPGTNGALTFSNGGSYDVATGLVTFPTVASLAGNGSVTYSVTFSAPGNGPFTGTAAVAAGTSDSNTTDNTATVTVNVSSAFDLSTTISSPATAGTGTPFTFSVITRNAGPAAATGVVQTVSLVGEHKGLFISNLGTSAYDGTNTIVTFPAQNIPAGQSRNNTISLQVATSGTFTATATVPALAGESSASNNSATASTVLSASTATAASVYSMLTTTSNGTPVTNVAAGTPLTLTLTSSNAGPGTAPALQPRLSLPADLNPATLTISNGGTYDPATGVVSWSNSLSLASGATATNSVQLPAPGFGPLLIHASTTTATPDPVPADNGMASIVTINPTADVVTTVVGPATVTAGQRVTYTITTINKGLMPAANVQQFVRMPPAVANLTYTNNVLPTSVGALNVQPDQALLAYPVITSLAPGQSVTNTVSFDAPSTSFPAVGYATTASADNTPANNSSTITVATIAASDVVARISGPATAVNGTPVVYSVDVRNAGTSPAGSISTSVYLPVNLSNVVVRNVAGVVLANAYDAATGLVTLPTQTNVPVGPSGATTSTITFNAPDVAAITATAVASVTTGTNDLSRVNNASTATTSVLRSGAVIVDMATMVQANAASQVTGQPVTFTVTTTNGGPATATSVVQRVALPAQLAAGTVTASNGGTYDPASGIVSWQYALQGVGSANAFTNTIMVTAPGTDPLTAVASVNSDNSDGTPTNNTSMSSVTITPALNLRAVVGGPSPQASALTGSVVAGQPVTYLLRALNDGPSAAQGVVFSAQIPANLDPATVSVSGGGTYVQATGAVTFPAIGTLEAGQVASAAAAYTITFPAPAGVASYPVTGTVTTSSTQSATDDTQTYSTNLANLAPVANTIVNNLSAPDGNTANSYLRLSPLSGRDADGSIASFTVASVPSATQGKLYFSADGVSFTAVTAPQLITATDADKLYFQPYSNPADPLNTNGQNFVGNAYFTYTATDNSAMPATSAATAYVLPVGQDNVALFTAGPLKGGAVPYQIGDVLSSGFDPNGGEYNATAEVTDSGIRSAALAAGSNALPAGTILDATTGRVTVANRLLLAAGTYTVTVATTDEFGGVTTQPVTLIIGARPLPVTLAGFEAVAKGNDALLTWATATEKNNAGFEVERSADGRSFGKVGTVAGHGNSTTRQQYSFTDVKAATVASMLYYRLKQLDQDGTINYTPVQVVRFRLGTVAPELTLHPNPATDVLHLTLTAAVQKGQVTVYSTTGALVLTKALDSNLGTTLDVAKLPQGAYLLKVTGENGVQQTRRFIKN